MADTCKDCFNGCLEKVPDNCVKYTGIDIPLLEIENGNSLAYIENQIFKYILSIITGQGITIDLDDVEVCALITSYLPTTGVINLQNIIKALVEAVCFVNSRLIEITNQINLLEADYDVKCLVGVTNSSNTHLTLQATIDKVCEIQANFVILLNDLSVNYITIGNINDYITNYNQTVGGINLISSKMIPYVAMPYFPTTAVFNGNFDSTGAGVGNWVKVYLCNGRNTTPDLRGRTLVGATTGMAGSIITDPDVLPSVGNYPNPNYSLKDVFGKNSVSLTNAQVPDHGHTSDTILTQTPHTHVMPFQTSIYAPIGGAAGGSRTVTTNYVNRTTELATIDIRADVVVNPTIGGGSSHTNTQPSIGCYYIMYIP